VRYLGAAEGLRFLKMFRALVRTLVTSRSGVAATAQTFLANVFILGINAGTGIITARLLGPSGRGELAAMIMWPQFLAYCLTLGVPSALLYNLKRYPGQASSLFSVALLLGTLMGLLATLVGVLFIPHWLTEYSPEVVRSAQWLMLTAPAGLLALMCTFALQAQEEFTLYNAARYLPPVLILLALGTLALVWDLTPFNAALSYLLAGMPVWLWMLVRLWRFYRPVGRGLGVAFKRLTSYGLRSYGIDLLGTLAGYLDQVLVVGILAPAMMGLYAVALSLSRMLEVLQGAAIAVLFPKASGRTVGEAAALAGWVARVSTALTLLAATGLALVSPWVLGLLYGQEFVGAVTVVRLLLLKSVLDCATLVLAQAFMAAGRPGIVTVLQGTGLALVLPLLLILVPRYGLEGAGLALLGSSAARLVFVIVSFPLILKVRPPRLWLGRNDLAPIVERARVMIER
jgi:O-antigen/teichoic acid export membrane protein